MSDQGEMMKKYGAEFIATFFLVFAGAGAIVADVYLSSVRVTASFGLLGIALAHALALALAIAAIGHISGGHANPAVTAAFLITRRIKPKEAAGYVVAQLAGAALAALLIKTLMPAEAVNAVGVGVPALGDGVDGRRGLVIEVVLTFFLSFVIWGVSVDKRGPRSIAPLAIGLVLGFDILAGGAFTGAAVNPARWFGPALLGGQWSNFWIWIVGPVLGALVGALVYETLFLKEQPPAEEELESLGEGDETEEELEPAGASRKPWERIGGRLRRDDPASAGPGEAPSPPLPGMPPPPPPPPPPEPGETPPAPPPPPGPGAGGAPPSERPWERPQ